MTEIHNQINALFVPRQRLGQVQHVCWHEENVRKLEELWKDKTLPASRIAEQFNTTRSSILSKVRCLGLEPRMLGRHHLRWTPEREKLLCELWEKRIGYTEMGVALGIGRKAVKSKCERMFSKAAIKNRALVVIKKKRSLEERDKARPEDARRLRRVELGFFTVPLECEAVSFNDVKECRWPYGDKAPFLFCNKKRFVSSSYCGYHTRLSYSRAA